MLQTRVAHSWRRLMIVYRVRAARNIMHDPNTVAARTGRRHQDVAVVTICRAGEGRRWTRCRHGRHRHGEHQSHEEKAAPALGVGGRHELRILEAFVMIVAICLREWMICYGGMPARYL